jgi:rhodanese-related sulfurtransferase
MMNMPQVTVQELAEKLAEASKAPSTALQFVDVREAQELAIASLPGFISVAI